MNTKAGNSTGNWSGRLYLRGDAGVSILQNMTVAQVPIQNTHDVPIRYNIGPKVDISLGYNITENIAVELQTGVAYNEISKFGSVSQANSDLWTVPVMANGIYRYAFNNHWQVYGGLGVGALIGMLNMYNFSPIDCEFGYQAMAGIKYRFNDHLECGLGYCFLGSPDHHWSDNGADITTSPTYMHAVLVSLTYRF